MRTFDVTFTCRPSKVDRNGLAPIELCITINGKRASVSLPRKEEPAYFKASVASKRKNDIKTYLVAVRSRLGEIETQLMAQGIPLSAQILRDYYSTGGIKLYTIENLFDDYFKILRKRIGVDLTQKTFRKYELARDRLLVLVDKSNPVSVLDNALMKDYMATLKRDFDYVTAQGYCQKIKTVCTFARANGKMNTDPFFDMKLRKGEKDVQFLSEDELARIRDTPIQNPSLNRIRDIFIFQANSGLSYCDLASLTKDEIKQTEEGHFYIHRPRQKTSLYYTAVIFPDGIEVLKRYNYNLPIISNQKYNAFLKSIAILCNIDKPLHTHVARHTYATMCLNHGLRLDVVAKLLGHTPGSKITRHHAKLLEKTVINEVRDAFSLQAMAREERTDHK